jgi:aryl-alcohol dehydrogenase-like predicted oxidoreductase
MNKNTRARHVSESPVGGDVDRRSFLKMTGAGLVAALPISTAPWAGPAAAPSTQSIKREAHVMKTRKLERNGVLQTCEELGIGFVPWGPLGQGFLPGTMDVNAQSTFDPKNDLRATFPRFSPWS